MTRSLVEVAPGLRALLAEVPALATHVDDVLRYVADVALDEPGSLAFAPRDSVFARAVQRDFHEDFVARIRGMVPTLTADELAERAGVSAVRQFAQRLRRANAIALPLGRSFLYPAFQFTADGNLLASVAAANARLLAPEDPWGAVAWWTEPNPRVGNRIPADFARDEDLLRRLLDADLE